MGPINPLIFVKLSSQYNFYILDSLTNVAALKLIANVQVSRKQIPTNLGTLFLIDDPSLSSEGEIKLMAGVGVVGVGDGKWLKVVEGSGVEVVMEVLDGELNGRGCIDVEESRELDKWGCIVVDVGRGSFGLLDGKG